MRIGSAVISQNAQTNERIVIRLPKTRISLRFYRLLCGGQAVVVNRVGGIDKLRYRRIYAPPSDYLTQECVEKLYSVPS